MTFVTATTALGSNVNKDLSRALAMEEDSAVTPLYKVLPYFFF